MGFNQTAHLEVLLSLRSEIADTPSLRIWPVHRYLCAGKQDVFRQAPLLREESDFYVRRRISEFFYSAMYTELPTKHGMTQSTLPK